MMNCLRIRSRALNAVVPHIILYAFVTIRLVRTTAGDVKPKELLEKMV